MDNEKLNKGEVIEPSLPVDIEEMVDVAMSESEEATDVEQCAPKGEGPWPEVGTTPCAFELYPTLAILGERIVSKPIKEEAVILSVESSEQDIVLTKRRQYKYVSEAQVAEMEDYFAHETAHLTLSLGNNSEPKPVSASVERLANAKLEIKAAEEILNSDFDELVSGDDVIMDIPDLVACGTSDSIDLTVMDFMETCPAALAHISQGYGFRAGYAVTVGWIDSQHVCDLFNTAANTKRFTDLIVVLATLERELKPRHRAAFNKTLVELTNEVLGIEFGTRWTIKEFFGNVVLILTEVQKDYGDGFLGHFMRRMASLITSRLLSLRPVQEDENGNVTMWAHTYYARHIRLPFEANAIPFQVPKDVGFGILSRHRMPHLHAAAEALLDSEFKIEDTSVPGPLFTSMSTLDGEIIGVNRSGFGGQILLSSRPWK